MPPRAPVVPGPDIDPPVHVSSPLTVTVPAPVNVPPERANWLTLEAAAMETDPAERLNVAWLVRLFTLSVLLVACVTVMPPMLMTPSSAATGTRLRFQLLAVFQSPP